MWNYHKTPLPLQDILPLAATTGEEADSSDEDTEEDSPSMRSSTVSGAPKPPSFPFLKISNLVPDGVPASFLPNTREAIDFDCATCSGQMIVMLRTSPIDPFYRWAFEGKKRYFELHFRLTFKTTPRGIVYVGGEIPKKMNLGVVSGAL
jgi:hypothetical protein